MENKCFNCSNVLPNDNKLFFCPSCLTQVKCKKCSENLLKNAVGCISCGTAIGISETKQSELNQIEFEQKGDLKKFKATFTDNVGHELVATFGGMIGAQPPKKKLFSMNTNKTNSMIELNSNLTNNTIDAEIIEEDDLEEALAKVFKVDGENLIFQTANFKSKNKFNKEIRIALLTLLGFKYIHNSEEIKRQILTEVLKRFKLNSGGFRGWINRSEEIGQKSGGLIFLTPNGLTTAIEVLKEVVDPSVMEGKVTFGKTKTGSKKGTTNENTSGAKKSPKGAKPFLLKLIDENYFSEKRNLTDIVNYLKDNKAVTFKTTDISGHMGKLLGQNGLKREKGTTGNYEYFI